MILRSKADNSVVYVTDEKLNFREIIILEDALVLLNQIELKGRVGLLEIRQTLESYIDTQRNLSEGGE